jgi:hypothetical protein
MCIKRKDNNTYDKKGSHKTDTNDYSRRPPHKPANDNGGKKNDNKK